MESKIGMYGLPIKNAVILVDRIFTDVFAERYAETSAETFEEQLKNYLINIVGFYLLISQQ